MFLAGIAYYKLTQDTADGNFAELRARGELAKRSGASGAFATACRDPRVWALFVIYGACFGMELTIDNIAALYFTDYFSSCVDGRGNRGRLLRHDEPVCPRAGRHRQRSFPSALGIARTRAAAGKHDFRAKGWR